MNNILVNDVGAETDAITSLRSPTHFGRPNVCPPILQLFPAYFLFFSSSSHFSCRFGLHGELTDSGTGYSNQ